MTKIEEIDKLNKLDKLKKEDIDRLKKENNKLSLRVNMIELGNMTHQFRQTIINTIFDDKPTKIRNIIEIQDCAYGKSPIKMGDDDLARWRQFVKSLEKENISIKLNKSIKLDEDIKKAVRNSVAHPSIIYK